MKIFNAYKQADWYTTFFNRLNVPRSIIWSFIKNYYEIHCVENKLRTDREQIISEKMERDVSKNAYLIAKYIINDVKAARLNVSVKTISRCYHQAGLRACCPRKTLLSKDKYLKNRIAYARSHLEHGSLARRSVHGQEQIRGRKSPGFGWAMMTSIVTQSSSLNVPSLNPHYNRSSGYWPCVKSCLVGGRDKHLEHRSDYWSDVTKWELFDQMNS